MPLWGLTFPDTGLSLAGLKGELSPDESPNDFGKNH